MTYFLYDSNTIPAEFAKPKRKEKKKKSNLLRNLLIGGGTAAVVGGALLMRRKGVGFIGDAITTKPPKNLDNLGKQAALPSGNNIIPDVPKSPRPPKPPGSNIRLVNAADLKSIDTIQRPQLNLKLPEVKSGRTTPRALPPAKKTPTLKEVTGKPQLSVEAPKIIKTKQIKSYTYKNSKGEMVTVPAHQRKIEINLADTPQAKEILTANTTPKPKPELPNKAALSPEELKAVREAETQYKVDKAVKEALTDYVTNAKKQLRRDDQAAAVIKALKKTDPEGFKEYQLELIDNIIAGQMVPKFAHRNQSVYKAHLRHVADMLSTEAKRNKFMKTYADDHFMDVYELKRYDPVLEMMGAKTKTTKYLKLYARKHREQVLSLKDDNVASRLSDIRRKALEELDALEKGNLEFIDGKVERLADAAPIDANIKRANDVFDEIQKASDEVDESMRADFIEDILRDIPRKRLQEVMFDTFGDSLPAEMREEIVEAAMDLEFKKRKFDALLDVTAESVEVAADKFEELGGAIATRREFGKIAGDTVKLQRLLMTRRQIRWVLANPHKALAIAANKYITAKKDLAEGAINLAGDGKFLGVDKITDLPGDLLKANIQRILYGIPNQKVKGSDYAVQKRWWDLSKYNPFGTQWDVKRSMKTKELQRKSSIGGRLMNEVEERLPFLQPDRFSREYTIEQLHKKELHKLHQKQAAEEIAAWEREERIKRVKAARERRMKNRGITPPEEN